VKVLPWSQVCKIEMGQFDLPLEISFLKPTTRKLAA